MRADECCGRLDSERGIPAAAALRTGATATAPRCACGRSFQRTRPACCRLPPASAVPSGWRGLAQTMCSQCWSNLPRSADVLRPRRRAAGLRQPGGMKCSVESPLRIHPHPLQHVPGAQGHCPPSLPAPATAVSRPAAAPISLAALSSFSPLSTVGQPAQGAPLVPFLPPGSAPALTHVRCLVAR